MNTNSLIRPIESTTFMDLGLVSGAAVLLAVLLYCSLLCICAVAMVPWLALRRAWDLLYSSSSCPRSQSSGGCLMCHDEEGN